ncbi:MAG: UMP kinase [Ruminococcaceae bacterium]|nr:UMP kinase [Oscillospiraceae bacterium]
MAEVKYKRILLKLSGEAMKGEAPKGLYDYAVLDKICDVISKLTASGVQVAIVVGAGNIWRGGRSDKKMDRTRADHMGMLGTTINALCLKDCLEHVGVDARVMTAVEMRTFAEPYVKDDAVRYLNEGKVVIFGCGTGSPYFSTDTAAVLRAAEIGADAVLFAKNVDGVYTADPKEDPAAQKLDEISYIDILKNGMKVMDLTAASFSMDNHLTILVFGLDDPENIIRVANGEAIGTIVK